MGAIAGIGVAGARVVFRARPQYDRGLIDWAAVERAALARIGHARDRWDPAERSQLYEAMATDLTPALAEVCGTVPMNPPAFRALDRSEFIRTNVEIVQRIVAPVERIRAQIPSSMASGWTRAASSHYIGTLFGVLARRVLGQYDPALHLESPNEGPRATPGLFLIETNVGEFERELRVPGDPLRRWLILHELTHAWQFGNHPWLAEHLGTMMRSLLVNQLLDRAVQPAADRDANEQRPSNAEMILQLPTSLRDQMREIGRIQALMSVLEGYSNFVMNRAGAAKIPEVDRLRAAFTRRRRTRPLLERLLITVTGLRVKLSQYEVGERFAESVADRSGLIVLNRVWEGPEMMPTTQELRDPGAWIRRVG